MRSSTAPKFSVALAFATWVVFAAVGHAQAQTMGSPERYRANAVNLDLGAQGLIDIRVERWSTDADRAS